MFQLNNNIAAGLALIVFISSTATFAAGDGSGTAASTDTTQTTQKKPAKKKRSKTAPKPAATAVDTAAAASTASATPAKAAAAESTAPAQNAVAPAQSVTPPPPISEPAETAKPHLAGTNQEDDSPEAIKQRSGPGDPIAGREKSELCQGCHGEEGISFEPAVPKLAGQYGAYIAKELRNFQAGTRTHQIMSDIAKTINDEDLADISAYFASRKKMKGNGTDNKLGEELFLHGDMSRMMVACVNCHGVNGKGKTPTNPVFPVIGGQQKDYLRIQLINFRAGDRTNSPGGVMNIITQRMTDPELEALADYVSGR